MPNPSPTCPAHECGECTSQTQHSVCLCKHCGAVAHKKFEPIAAPSDESRERFEKWAINQGFTLGSINFKNDRGRYCYVPLNDQWIAWQAAERDTRELCAQRAEEIDEQLIDLLASDERDLDRFKQKLARIARAMAERIRGKGEA